MQLTTLPAYDPAQPALHFRRLFFLHGPNLWSRSPVLEVWVDLANLKDWSSEIIPGFNERYKAWLPSVIEHRCSVGERGGFFQRLDRGTYLAHILEHTTLELQTLAGSNMGFGRAREMSEEGVYKVAVRYEEEALAQECLFAARELLIACIYDKPYDVQSEIKRLRELGDRRLLGPSSRAILAAALARNIPHRRMTRGSLVQLGYGNKQRRIWTAETDRTSAIAETIAQDKQLTKQLLSTVHVPVPEGRAVTSAEDAWTAAQEIGEPVVVKPQAGNHGRGVFPNLSQREEVMLAYNEALAEECGVIVERFVPGFEHRILVVGNRVVAATRGEPVYVVGDGKRTIEQLIVEEINTDPRRGEAEDFPLAPLEIGRIILMILKTQGLTFQSIPTLGQKVLVSHNDDLSIDVTDEVHPLVAQRAVLAARAVGLDVAGLDMVLQDVSRPIEEQRGAVVEVNAGPGLSMHLKPSVGKPRPVGEAIIDLMFPPGEDARIPLVCVTGTNGKTTVVRILRHLLKPSGLLVGSTDSTGQYVGDWQLEAGPCDDGPHAREVLLNPDVSAAVFEAGVEGILRDGLGFDKCTVAIVTNLDEPDHLGGEFDLWSEEKLFGVKRTPVDVVLETGAAVLNAADSESLKMLTFSKGDVILFARDPALPALVEHLAAGKRAVLAEGGQIVLCNGAARESLCSLADVPLTHGGKVAFQVENVLAAVAGAWQLDLPREMIALGVKSLPPGEAIAERFSVQQAGKRTLVKALASNVGALRGLVAGLDQLQLAPSRAIAYAVRPDRRDADLVAQGEFLGKHFAAVYLYELSGPQRPVGEGLDRVQQGIQQSNANCPSHRCDTAADAHHLARSAETGVVVLS